MSAQADLVAGLFGARGSGKTHTARQYLENVKPSRVLILDPMGQFKGLAES